MTLEWLQHEHDPNCFVTACRRYSVSVCEGRWSAWRMVPSGSHFAPIAQKLTSKDDAVSRCEADLCAQP